MGRRISIVRFARVAPFPRPGEPIVPGLLQSLLIDRHPQSHAGAVDLHAVGSLGAEAWTKLPPEICRRAGATVVDRVQTRLQALPDAILDAPLPDPSTVLTFTLERRTANTLRRAAAAGRTGQWSLRRYLCLPRFGGRAVVDLLAAVEAHGQVSPTDDNDSIGAKLALIVADLPISQRRAHLLLASEGFPPPAIDLGDLARAAVRSGARVPFRMVELAGFSIAVRPPHVTAAQSAYRLAARAVRGWGAARIRAISAQLRGAPDLDESVSFVARVLAEIESFRWIDRREGWFLFVGQPNPLLAELKKILSVRSHMSLAALRAVLFRTRRRPWLSTQALAAICLLVPGIRLAGDHLVLDGPLDPSLHLSAHERRVVAILEDAEGALPAASLRARLGELGASWASVLRMLRRSPLIAGLPGGLVTMAV
jgi:hypothetical protein